MPQGRCAELTFCFEGSHCRFEGRYVVTWNLIIKCQIRKSIFKILFRASRQTAANQIFAITMAMVPSSGGGNAAATLTKSLVLGAGIPSSPHA